MTYRLGFIGGGNMSTAIFNGILKSNVHPASKIWVSSPHIENLSYWTDKGATATMDNGVVFDNCDIIFLGMKPNQLDSALKTIQQSAKMIEKKVLFISMLAGKNIDAIRTAVKCYLCSATIKIVRIMPNTPVTVGAGICLYTPDPTVSDLECHIIETLLRKSGLCERVPENLMNSLGSLIGCGPAFIYLVIEALADGAVKQGVPRSVALRHTAQMVAGSAQMVLETGKHPCLLKDEVCSPGGSTIAGISALENGNLRATLINAVEAATQRTTELGK